MSEHDDLDTILVKAGREHLDAAKQRVIELGRDYPKEAERLIQILDEFRNYGAALADVARKLIEERSYMDPLTGLPDRRFLMRKLERELERNARVNPDSVEEVAGNGVFLYLIDGDHLKKVNSTLGLPYGDDAIIQLGERIQTTVRDDVCRLGGDEFAFTTTRLDLEEAIKIGARILEAVNGQPFTLKGDYPTHMSVSIGLSRAELRRNIQAEVLYTQADAALREAKQTRNTLEIFDGSKLKYQP